MKKEFIPLLSRELILQIGEKRETHPIKKNAYWVQTRKFAGFAGNIKNKNQKKSMA